MRGDARGHMLRAKGYLDAGQTRVGGHWPRTSSQKLPRQSSRPCVPTSGLRAPSQPNVLESSVLTGICTVEPGWQAGGGKGERRGAGQHKAQGCQEPWPKIFEICVFWDGRGKEPFIPPPRAHQSSSEPISRRWLFLWQNVHVLSLHFCVKWHAKRKSRSRETWTGGDGPHSRATPHSHTHYHTTTVNNSQ